MGKLRGCGGEDSTGGDSILFSWLVTIDLTTGWATYEPELDSRQDQETFLYNSHFIPMTHNASYPMSTGGLSQASADGT